MPRVGLNTTEVVAAGAALADEQGIGAVSFAALAERLGVKAPALYKHVESVGDLRHRIATLAMTELGDALRDALQGRSRGDAIAAVFATVDAYVVEHPGRYAATTGATFDGDDDPLLVAGTRVMESLRAVLSGYGLDVADLDHAIRGVRCMLHGFAVLQAADAFQWGNDPADSVAWMIRFVDAGLSSLTEPGHHPGGDALRRPGVGSTAASPEGGRR